MSVEYRYLDFTRVSTTRSVYDIWTYTARRYRMTVRTEIVNFSTLSIAFAYKHPHDRHVKYTARNVADMAFRHIVALPADTTLPIKGQICHVFNNFEKPRLHTPHQWHKVTMVYDEPRNRIKIVPDEEDIQEYAY